MIKQDIILFSTADWDTPYWTNKQHMAKEFASLGHRVLYIESVGLRKPKISSGTDWKRIFFRLFRGLRVSRNVDSNIWALSPLVLPFAHGNNWVIAINQFMMTLQIKIFARKKGINNPLIWTYHPYILNIIDNLKYNNRLIYHCVDDLSAVPGIDKGLFKCAEKKLLKRADIVFVTNKTLERQCSQLNKNTYYYPNVVDFEHFSSSFGGAEIPSDLIQIKEPRILYMGALSEFKIDLSLLEKVIKELPNCNFVFIGAEIEGQSSPLLERISLLKNSYFLGYKKYKDLPRYLHFFNIGLLIIKENEYTKSMSPMKFYEYIASGLFVVSNHSFYSLSEKDGLYVGQSSREISKLIKIALKKRKLTYIESKLIVSNNTWKDRLKYFNSVLEKN